MSSELNLNEGESVKFLEGESLKTSLMLLPFYATEEVSIMVPYLGRGQILNSIINIPNTIEVNIYTRDRKGYLPSIKNEADPTLNILKEKKNIKIFIDNKIHAKIWKIDNKIVVVHSMNGTFHSENHNFEAGILTNDIKVISDISKYFSKVRKQASIL
ncbi:MAG: hypothetical protein HeimC3_06440 [Candidatus Heimdallarchaeota archaeon LC_3]|nr:MAG: hypothetical protein HeimC3_06440 [Candidatus Heimdallarchaeota archaeon LC_3]